MCADGHRVLKSLLSLKSAQLLNTPRSVLYSKYKLHDWSKRKKSLFTAASVHSNYKGSNI